LLGITVILLFVLVGFASPVLAQGKTSIGRVWHVTELGGWTATWTRRGDSMVFDGLWLRDTQRVTGVLTMTVQGSTIRIQSRQQTNNYDVDYEGTLAQDGRSIRGSLLVIRTGTRQNWQATIDTAGATSPPPPPPPSSAPSLPPSATQTSLGRVWHVTEIGSWTATWTRRGDSVVFDGLWLRGTPRVTGVLTMTVQGSTIRIQSRQQTNNYDVDYEGTLAQDGRSIRGSLLVIRTGTRENWQATIDAVGATSSPQPPPPSSAPTPPPTVLSLTGPWVHSADPNFKTHDDRVIVIQEGTQVTITNTWKYNGRWMVVVCRGPLSGNTVRAQCHYAPGGNPFGFGEGVATWVLSRDWNHLDGTILGGQESHYSRIP
jgi:hypothetical protein